MNSSYTVPVIPQNLSNHETIIQIAEALNHLSAITEDIFCQVNKRLEKNTINLTKLSERLDTVNSKVNKLKGAKKATQVFSSSKYPAGELCREYVSVFDNITPIELKRHKVKHKNFSSTYEPIDKLQFYHVKVHNKTDEKLEGLGHIPSKVEYVNDLLLYNTGKNLYKNFVITDALKSRQTIKEGDNLDTCNLGAAPASISEKSSLTRSVTQSYFYTPKIGELPALDVPLDLPDLPGIADDVRYENEIGPGIAPSALNESIFENLIDLPEVPPSETITPELPDINIPFPPSVELPPPPPLNTIIPEQPQNVQTEKPLVVKQEPEKLPEVHLPPPNDARASLMEAIRSVGGSKNAKLRNIKPKEEVKSEKAPEGDLMADLYAKLLLRRKGISGSKKAEQEGPADSESTFSKISAMIPPPSKKDVETTSDDDDWE